MGEESGLTSRKSNKEEAECSERNKQDGWIKAA
jgi:hypothetical protein